MLTIEHITKATRLESQTGGDYRNALCPHYIDSSIPNYHPEFKKSLKEKPILS